MNIDDQLDFNSLKELDIKILKKTYREGEKHMKYFYSTMSAFQFPEKRAKTFDTQYYERVMPEIAKILSQYDRSKKR